MDFISSLDNYLLILGRASLLESTCLAGLDFLSSAWYSCASKKKGNKEIFGRYAAYKSAINP
jgi:hypothetical protein